MTTPEAPAAPTAPRAPDAAGELRSAAGDSLAGIMLRVTDMTSGHGVAEVVVDAHGRFAFDAPAGRYAISATSEHGYVYVENIEVPSAHILLTLSENCSVVTGRLRPPVEAGAAVMLARSSAFVGDRFIVALGPSGAFHACLPEGSYSAKAAGTMISFARGLHVPPTETPGAPGSTEAAELAEPIEIVPYARARVDAAANVPLSMRADLSTFVHLLHGGARVLGLGEANHGTGDFYTLRGALSLELARLGSLDVVLLEADAIAMFAIDDYVQGRNLDVEQAVRSLGFWITDIRELIRFLDSAREVNRARPAARRIHVLGFDAQSSTPPAELLLASRRALAISSAEAELLARVSPNRARAFQDFGPGDRKTLTSLLARLETPPPHVELTSSTARAAIAARSLRLQLGYITQGWRAGVRDTAMADLVELVTQLCRACRASVWAHNGHIAREPDGTTKSMGQHLAERLGPQYYPLAFLSYAGTARAWDPAEKIGVIAHTLDPTRPSNLETMIMSGLGFPDVAWVRFDDLPASAKAWLATPRYAREFGAVYTPDNTQTLRDFPRAFDAVVVVKHALASTPTPTGERRAVP